MSSGPLNIFFSFATQQTDVGIFGILIISESINVKGFYVWLVVGSIFGQTSPSSTFTFRSSFQMICYQTGSLSKIWTSFFRMVININRPFPFPITVKQRKTEEVLTTYVTKFSSVVGKFPVFSMLGKWTSKSPVVVLVKLVNLITQETLYVFISVEFYRANKSSARILIRHKWIINGLNWLHYWVNLWAAGAVTL